MIISAIDLPLAQAQTQDKDNELLEYLSRVSLISTVVLRLPAGQVLDEPYQFFLSTIVSNNPCFAQGFTVDDDEIATRLLDDGLHVAFFNLTDDKTLLSKVVQSLPRSRVGISAHVSNFSKEFMESVVAEFGKAVGHFTFSCSSMDPALLKAAKDLIHSSELAIQICFELPTGWNEASAVSIGTYTEGLHCSTTVCMRDLAQSPPKVYANPYGVTPTASVDIPDIISTLIASLRSDRADKLYTTVVCDEQGVCLGLVYSNVESIRIAILEKRGVYWSRSRSSLWRKGDSSGMFQDLLQVKMDCDYDALRFTVCQRGNPPAFCHLMTRTCWGPVTGIQKLETILLDRKKSAPEGSYTKRLFDDPELLRKKLLEEVQELVEAEEPDHVAAEAADVLYFALTRCVAAGVGLREIEQHLEKRTFKVTRRPGNAKEWRTQAAEQVFSHN